MNMNKSNHKTGPPIVRWLIAGGALLLLALVLYACTPAATPVPTTPPPTPIPPVPTVASIVIPDQSAIWVAWQSGPHRDDYDVGKGPNTMCTRCHSPLNWIPGSKAAAAPNCVTCKFATDAALRIAPTFAEGGMDFVSAADWVGIPCKQCHEVDANGTASAEIAWLQPVSLTYEKINTPNELCVKCHANPAGAKVSSAGLSANHEIILGGSAHMNYAGEWPQADRPKYCTDCHDPHSSAVKQCVDCHTDTAATHTRVTAMMDKVTCQGCHDASGAAVGRAKPDALFTTILVTPGRGSAPATTAEIVSHSTVYMVSCNRCHKAGNTYGLQVLTAAGTVPTPAPTPTKKP
jgi:hypothetical protein